MKKTEKDKKVIRGKEGVLKAAQDLRVKFVHLWFTDILGFLKSFAITVEELEGALNEGMGFDGSSIEGFARVDESDMVAKPDPNTFCIIPWGGREGGAVARMFCDIYLPGGKPFEGDPRWVLKKNLKRTQERGYTCNVGPELEFFYFRSSEGQPEVLDQAGYFDLTPRDTATDLRRETVLALEEMGIGVEYSHHEGAFSQHEIDLRYTDALAMADHTMTYRLIVKEIAIKNGVYASFMPKPIQEVNGSGMHTHMSLFTNKGGRERNAFFDPKDKIHFSVLGKRFLAGLLRHAPEITMVTNQWVNSYKRLVPGYEAPVYISWAVRSRADLIRIPEYKPGHENSTRLEYRSPDPACNPYLVFSVMLAAGLEGIEKEYSLPPPSNRNVFEMTEKEREAAGIAVLPADLNEAIKLTEKSALVRRALGEHLFEKLIENKKIEWRRYRTQVTDYEIKRYYPIL
ncbi:MAG: glutamine synthetase family protein [Candidatus Omnitrophota bacterium]